MAKFASAFRKAANQAPAEKKSKTVSTRVDASQIGENLVRWIQAKMQEKDAKSRKMQEEVDIIEFGHKRRQEVCQAAGKVESSVVLDGGQVEIDDESYHPQVRFTVKKNWKVRDPEAVLGTFNGEFDSYFNEETSVTLQPDAVQDTTLLAKLIKACEGRLTVQIDPSVLGDERIAGKIVKVIGGANKISEVFQVEQKVTATDRFHSDMVLSKSLIEKVEPLLRDEAITNDKPTLKENGI